MKFEYLLCFQAVAKHKSFSRAADSLFISQSSLSKKIMALEEALGGEGTATDIYRIILTGETDERGVDLKALRQTLEERFYRLELRDETAVARDVWARADEDSLRGLFLKNLLRRKAAAQTEEERARIDRAARIGLAALDKRDI